MARITSYQIDTLKELINIGIGRAASALNAMVRFRVNLQVPFIKVLTLGELHGEMAELGRNRVAAVKLDFDGPFSGTAAIVFPPDSASKLVAVLTGEEPGSPDLDAVRAGTLSEVGNIVINGVMGSIGNVIEQQIVYALPVYSDDTVENLILSGNMAAHVTILLVRTHFSINQLEIEGDILVLFGVGSFDALLHAIERSKGRD